MTDLNILTVKDRKWMASCEAHARTFSTCSKRQYAAIIVDRHGALIGSGYNGGPSGMQHCNEGGCPRAINNVPGGTPYDYGPGLCIAIHAEANALLHSDYTARRHGGTLYVNGPPCMGCAKLVANSGLGRIVYIPDDAGYSNFADCLDLWDKADVVHVRCDADAF